MIDEGVAKELDLDGELIGKLEEFASIFLEWNRVHNLGGAKDLKSLTPHIIDSIYPLKFLEDFKTSMDIGTGAGFPGLLLAICKKDAHFTLVEPRVKRVSFLNFVKSNLGLENVDIRRERVEDLEEFKVDLVTSKAVSSAKVLYELSERFLKEDSRLLLYKGKNTEEEAKEFEKKEIFRFHNSSYVLISK